MNIVGPIWGEAFSCQSRGGHPECPVRRPVPERNAVQVLGPPPPLTREVKVRSLARTHTIEKKKSYKPG